MDKEWENMSNELYDVVIIGGGPAGATAAIYTARANLKTAVLDKSSKAGALGITSKIANYPGVPEELTGVELLERMIKQAEGFNAVFKKTKVVGTDLKGDIKKIFTAEGEVYSTRTVILASGAMGKSNLISGEDTFLGKGVSYCATCDGAFFKGKDVLVYGSNEEAFEEAVFLTRFASKVYLASPKPLDDSVPEHIKSNDKIAILSGKRLIRIEGDKNVKMAIISSAGGEEKLQVAGVFIYTQGNKPIVEYLGGTVPTNGPGCIIANDEMATSIPGVFACGDILCNDVQQAVVAAAQGCIAALSVDKYLNKRAKVKKDYS